MAIKKNLIIDQGANFQANITALDAQSNIINLTSYTAQSQMRKHYTSNTAFNFTVATGGNTGIVTLSMNAAQTANIAAGRYVYDCEATNTSTNAVIRVCEGIVTVTPNVTR